MNGSAQSALRVLIVDDNQGDVRILADLLREADGAVEVYSAPDGPEALDFLLRPETPKPDIILLDVNMPKMSGHDVLSNLREHDAFRYTTVLMLSSSTEMADREEAYRRNANGYLKKPFDLDRYSDIARSIIRFWGRLNTPMRAAHS